MLQNWKTSASGGATLALLWAKVIAPKYGFDFDFLMFAIGVLAIGQVFGADAATVLQIRRVLEDIGKR